MKSSTDKYILILLILFVIFTRLWGLGDVESFILDEFMHVPSAESYHKTGHTTPASLWDHPPLRHILLYASIKVFGDNPYGWRMRNALAGILSVFILFLLGKELFPDTRIAYMAGAFLAIEPLHIFLSRTTAPEIVAVFFFLTGVYATVKYLKGNANSIIIAGIFLGLAISSKWYFMPALLILLAFILYYEFKEHGLRWIRIVYIFSLILILPLSIYLLTFYAWFGRGYNLSEFVQMQIDAYRILQGLRAEMYSKELTYSSSAIDWFIKPTIIIAGATKGIWSKYHILMNNFPIWMLVFPSLAFTALKAIKFKNRNLFLIILLFSAIYLQFFLVRRPIFLYSALPCLPFAYLFVAFSVSSLFKRYIENNRSFGLIMAIIFLWGLYLYPLILGKYVPEILYAPLLSIENVP